MFHSLSSLAVQTDATCASSRKFPRCSLEGGAHSANASAAQPARVRLLETELQEDGRSVIFIFEAADVALLFDVDAIVDETIHGAHADILPDPIGDRCLGIEQPPVIFVDAERQ